MNQFKNQRFERVYNYEPNEGEIRAVIKFFTIKSVDNFEKLGLEKKNSQQRSAIIYLIRAYIKKYRVTPHTNSPEDRANFFGYKSSRHLYLALSGSGGLSIHNRAVKVSKKFLSNYGKGYIIMPEDSVLELFHKRAENNHLKYGAPKDVENQKYFRDLVLRAYYLTFKERPKKDSNNDNAKYFGYSSSSELYAKLVNKKKNRIRAEVAQRAAMLLKEEFKVPKKLS